MEEVISSVEVAARLGNREQGTENREQGTGIREQGTGNREQGTGIREQGTGIREQGTGNRDQGTGNREQDQGTGIREQGTGNREQKRLLEGVHWCPNRRRKRDGWGTGLSAKGSDLDCFTLPGLIRRGGRDRGHPAEW